VFGVPVAPRFGDDLLSWFGLWVVMGSWSLICSLLIFVMLRRRTSATAPFTMRNLMAFQTQYAPGAILASFGDWLSLDGVIMLLGSLSGLPAVAETRAVFTLANPFMQFNAVLHVTWLIRFAEQGDRAKLFKVACAYSLGMGACVAVLAGISDWLIGVLYAGRYVTTAWQLPVLVAAIGLSGLSAMVTSLFKTRGGLWQGFLPSVVGGISAVLTAAVAVPFLGQTGAFYGIVGGSVAALIAAMLLYRFAFPKTRDLTVERPTWFTRKPAKPLPSPPASDIHLDRVNAG
jgi:O-antigen/teichoic acid export membrane protein